METTPKVEPEVAVKAIPDDVVRKMPHEQWLREFAQVLGMTRPNSPPMTPFRQGAIAKLRLAAQYIALLHKELHWVSKDNISMRLELKRLGVDRDAIRPDAERIATEKGVDNGNSATPGAPASE